jgi:hypothetical protein
MCLRALLGYGDSKTGRGKKRVPFLFPSGETGLAQSSRTAASAPDPAATSATIEVRPMACGADAGSSIDLVLQAEPRRFLIERLGPRVEAR